MRGSGDAAIRPVTKRSGRNGDPASPNVVTHAPPPSQSKRANSPDSPLSPNPVSKTTRIHAGCLRSSACSHNPAGASP